MKKFGFGICVFFLVIMISNAVFAHWQMVTVYKNTIEKIIYDVVPQEKLASYVASGWSLSLEQYDTNTHTPMYSDDKRVEIVPNEYVEAQKTVWWYTSPRKTMYSFDNRTINVNLEDVQAYENAYWFIEKPALVTKDGAYKYVLESEIQAYRQAGWNVKEYMELYDLGVQLKNYISNKRGQYGIYVKNLNTDQSLIINDGSYSSASIIKLFVMASVYNEMGYDGIQANKDVQNRLNAMITVSDNYSSNYLVRTIGRGNYLSGFNAENDHTKSLGCTGTQHKSLFSGYGDYVSYGRNFVSPVDCGILLEKIYDGTLVSPESSAHMLSMLKNQQRRNKIPQGLPKGTVCANKTGETSTVESDVAIVYSPNCDYIICVITNGSSSGIADIREISKMTYNYFNR